jgi:hypothetical protein
MRIIVCCCLLFLLNGCIHAHCNPNCIVTMDELLNKNRDKAFIVDSFADERVVILKDKGQDTVNAGCYTFYESGKLKSYEFIIDEDTADYAEEYDTSGNITNVIGKPLTQVVIKQVNADSVFVTMYFFSLNKEYQSLHIKTNTDKEYTIALADDTLRYTNTKYASIGINHKGYDNITAYWDVAYKNTCTDKTALLQDSATLYPDPN